MTLSNNHSHPSEYIFYLNLKRDIPAVSVSKRRSKQDEDSEQHNVTTEITKQASCANFRKITGWNFKRNVKIGVTWFFLNDERLSRALWKQNVCRCGSMERFACHLPALTCYCTAFQASPLDFLFAIKPFQWLAFEAFWTRRDLFLQ